MSAVILSNDSYYVRKESHEEGRGEAERSEGPILGFKDLSKSHRAIKCKCRKSWCPECSKTLVIKPLVEHVQTWDWRRVRTLTLTINPSDFESPAEAFDYVQSKKLIPNLFRNLERSAGVVVHDWVRVLEWHRSGFPHWHLLVLVDKAGGAGRIGVDNLRRYWPPGWRLREDYIRNAKHWQRITGYWQKAGYFEDKKGKSHQVSLPDWARSRKTPIRRIGRKAGVVPLKPSDESLLHEKEDHRGQEEKADDLGEWFERQSEKLYAVELTEGEKLELCGCAVEIYQGPDWSGYVGTVRIPYQDFIRLVPGEFVDGYGFVFDPDSETFQGLQEFMI